MSEHRVAGSRAPEASGHPLWRGPRIAGEHYEIRIDHRDTFQVACVAGDLPIELFLSTLHILGIESDGVAEPAMLVDLRELATDYSAADLVRVGQEIAASFIHMERLALLVLPRQVTRISERTARRTGMNMCVFDAEDDALGWVRRADV
jgi:hypothetical protein